MAHKRIDTFLSNGTFTAPATGTYTFFGIGAGGGGKTNAGSGGGGGSSWVVQAMTQNETAAIVVGTSAIDTNGTDTTVTYSSTVICRAKGGLSVSNGSTGGRSTFGVGSTKYSGGNGVVASGFQVGGGGGGTQSNGSTVGGNYFGGTGASGLFANYYGTGGGGQNVASYAGMSGVVFVFYDVATPSYPEITDRAYSRNSGTSHVITMPTFDVGDLLLAMFSTDGTPTITVPGDWTLLDEESFGTAVKGGIYYKYATGSDSLTLTTSASEVSTAICYAIKYGGIPTCTAANGDSTNPDCPSHAITSAKALWIAFVARDSESSINNVTAQPTGYKDFQYLTPPATIGGADMAVSTIHYEGTTQNPSAYTATTEQWAAFTIAIPYLAPTQTKKRRITYIN